MNKNNFRLLSFAFLFTLFFSFTAHAVPNWSSVDQLIKQQKFSVADKQLSEILQQAKTDNDFPQWTRALVERTKFKMARDEVENAVVLLQQEEWPKDKKSQVILSLFYAKALSHYIQRYSWEIRQREIIETQPKSTSKTTLKKMTLEQLLTEANHAYETVWNGKDVWSDVNTNDYTYYFEEGSYPQRIRGTFRDTLTYLWTDFLGDESLWSASQSNQVITLDLAALLAPNEKQQQIALSDSKTHPLKRVSRLLANLEHWHQQHNHPEAALEAAQVRLFRLYQSMSDKPRRQGIINTLGKRIEKDSALPWSTMARWTLARMVKNLGNNDSLIQSKAVLDKCVNQHANSSGTKRCTSLLDEILHPQFQMRTMRSDGLQKRSIEVKHKSLKRLYFRAWKVDLKEYQTQYGRNENALIKGYLSGKKAHASWSKALPETKDYHLHRTYVTPPMKEWGYWFVMASDDAAFDESKANMSAIYLNLTSLVAATNNKKNNFEVTVYQGESGQLAPNVNVEVWTRNYNKPNQRIAVGKTGKDGRVNLPVKGHHNHFILLSYDKGGTHKDSTWFDHASYYPRYQPSHRKTSLIFTDRSIYRPDHTVQWKVVAYQGDEVTGNYRVLPNTKGWVELRDTHGKVVEKKAITTNAFGSASGKFTLKSGTMLGRWNLATSWDGYKGIRVEEYKRPTFAVEFNDSESAFRLNKKAKVTGTARYFFGSPVSEGNVKWSVSRTPVYRTWYRQGQPEVLASGTAAVNTEGGFDIEFIPSPIPSVADLPEKPRQYSFVIKADITDSGGETRSAERTFRIGDVSIETDIQVKNPFISEGDTYQLDLLRADLDGTPREGNASWSLHTIQQPAKPILPSEIPLKLEADRTRFATAGDKLRPRWNSSENRGNKKTLWANWKAGKSVSQGALKHDKEGKAEIKLNALSAGLYRLKYITQDAWGKRFETQQDLMVVSSGKNEINVPSLLKAKTRLVDVGENVELLVGSGFKDMPVILDVYHAGKRIKHHVVKGGVRRMTFPVSAEHQGGLTFITRAVQDYQVLTDTLTIAVPRKDRFLDVSFSTFRDKLQPGQKEKWRITVKDSKGQPLAKGAAEVLASMYDKSLDFFTPHSVFDIAALYPERYMYVHSQNTQGSAYVIWGSQRKALEKDFEAFKKTRLANYERQMRRFARGETLAMSMAEPAPAPMSAKAGPGADQADSEGANSHSHPSVPNCTKAITHSHPVKSASHEHKYSCKGTKTKGKAKRNELGKQLEQPVAVRTNFNETAFFYPDLLLDEDGSVSFEFEVPESLTEWKVWVSALTKDMRGGSLSEQVRTSKDLVVRPYLPRFLREGDQAEIEVVINNSGEKDLSGQLEFEIFDPESGESRADEFKLENTLQDFAIKAGESSHLSVALSTPKKPGLIAIRTKARAGKLSDGEQRPLAILPSRIHLAQSKFATLKDNDTKTLVFNDLANNHDTTRINDKLVVNVEGQLFYSVLNALPYLADYPYQCTEQTLNRYLSAAIVKSVFDQHPAVASMAKKLSTRESQLEKWNEKDANRSMLLEETPWLIQSEGGDKDAKKLFRLLDPVVANELRIQSLEKLRKAQTISGGFPWWPGGPPSVYATQYQLIGYARTLEFSSPNESGIKKDTVKRAWRYLHNETKNKLGRLGKLTPPDLTAVTYTNYILSSYPDASWTGGVFTKKEQQEMLAFSFKHWRDISPLLRSYLALTLHRKGRHQDAKLVFDSVMDSAKTSPELGTYWMPEDRSWLWYNDTVDTHAFILRALMELNPKDLRRHGMVQWLMLDKKLNHWKSTRATAESIYALVHYLKQEGQLGIEEKASLNIGTTINKELVFKPDEYTGHKNQVVVDGEDITPDMATITVDKESKGLMFASATWHYSTDQLPKQAKGDFFHVTRKFYKRVQKAKQWILQPLAEGAVINVGDQLEVQLSLRAKHNAEYIHLRSPRGAGFEPMSHTSEYKRDLGIGYYEEIRDSGANYFFERLPAGEYGFKYRLRAATAGQFRTAPAMVQSMYAPEFVAYSSGKKLQIK